MKQNGYQIVQETVASNALRRALNTTRIDGPHAKSLKSVISKTIEKRKLADDLIGSGDYMRTGDRLDRAKYLGKIFKVPGGHGQPKIA